MITKILKTGKKNIEVKIPEKNYLYFIEPNTIDINKDDSDIYKALKNPISSETLVQIIKPNMKVVVLVDDITRPTPNKKIIPILLDELNKAGVADKDIKLIIALGTHRYMTRGEIQERFGENVYKRVNIVNNEWKNNDIFINLGTTENGTPVIINKMVYEADFVIGVGTIATHDLAGWSGGSKIIQPGVCSWDTTQATHLLAGRGDLVGNLGKEENDVRKEIERVGKIVGLNFIINTVLDGKNNILKVVCGDPIHAYREGVKYAKPIFERSIPGLADIVITNSYPADLDYWQGVKPLLLAQKGVKENGTIILIGDFPEGISPTHLEYGEYACKSYDEIEDLYSNRKIQDGVCASALMIHSRCLERAKVICISEGLSGKDKESLNFKEAKNIDNALALAFKQQGKNARIGIIEYGGDVIPMFER